jgi:predicted nucleotidyltransferase
MLKKKFKVLQSRLLREIKSFYGDRLISVVIFGSLGRETQTFDSDVDVLIIAKKLPRGRMKRVAEFERVEVKMESLLESLRKEAQINTYISPILKTPEEAERGTPLFIDMVHDARVLFDREGFFEKILERLKNRLKTLGAKRIWKGNAWYWVLKPDYKPGEIFEL